MREPARQALLATPARRPGAVVSRPGCRAAVGGHGRPAAVGQRRPGLSAALDERGLCAGMDRAAEKVLQGGDIRIAA